MKEEVKHDTFSALHQQIEALLSDELTTAQKTRVYERIGERVTLYSIRRLPAGTERQITNLKDFKEFLEERLIFYLDDIEYLYRMVGEVFVDFIRLRKHDWGLGFRTNGHWHDDKCVLSGFFRENS